MTTKLLTDERERRCVQRLVMLRDKVELHRKNAERKWVKYYKSGDYELSSAFQRESYTLEDIGRELSEIVKQHNGEIRRSGEEPKS